MPSLITKNTQRNHLIELLRIVFIFLIITGHIACTITDANDSVYSFLGLKYWKVYYFAVELFFITGGFFLYKTIEKTNSPLKIIKKYYLRLLIPLLFVFILSLMCGFVSLEQFPLILTMVLETGIHSEIIYWGDWYPCIYFWSICLFTGIFFTCKKQSMMLTIIILFVIFSVLYHIPCQKFSETYLNFIPYAFLRGISSVGLGVMAAYLSSLFPKILHNKNIIINSLFTAIEITCLAYTFAYLLNLKSFYSFSVQIMFSLMLIATFNFPGYITKCFAKLKFIPKLSKYVYPVFISQIFCINIVACLNSIYEKPANETAIVLIYIYIIALGAFEYHVIEKWLIPNLKNLFKRLMENNK